MCDNCKAGKRERSFLVAALRERDRHLAHLHLEVRLLWVAISALFVLMAMFGR